MALAEAITGKLCAGEWQFPEEKENWRPKFFLDYRGSKFWG
jgi:hypothetical protein